MSFSGFAQKMSTQRDENGLVQYHLGDFHLNSLVGERIHLSYEGKIRCVFCEKPIRKAYGQGSCYPCLLNLAQNDLCMVRPETCHHSSGTCRDEQFAQDVCFLPHIVYLANSSGLKVGITRFHQRLTRFMDQGAVQAVPLVKIPQRKLAGVIEVLMKKHLNDKTNWRKMLKGEVSQFDLIEERDKWLEHLKAEDLPESTLLEESVEEFSYPVKEYPTKIVSHNLDKVPEVEGVLMGIKGQYLIFDTGVLNIRKYSGYKLNIHAA